MMRIIINGKIRENKDLFKAVTKKYGNKYDLQTSEEYYIRDVKVVDDSSGNFYLDINNHKGDVPAQIPQEMIIGFSIMSGLGGIRRTRGIYELGKAQAVVDGTNVGIVEVTGTSQEDVRNLYLKIRAGDILPERKDNWDAEQIKPSFGQKLRSNFRSCFRSFFSW